MVLEPAASSSKPSENNAGWMTLRVAIFSQIAAFVFAGFFAYAFLVERSTKELKPGAWPQVIGLLPLWAVLLLGVRLVAKRRGVSAFGNAPRLRRSDLPWFVVGVVGQFAVGLLYLPFNVDTKELEKPAKDLIDSTGGRNFSFYVLAVAVAFGAPIVEELFYRGLVWRGTDLVIQRQSNNTVSRRRLRRLVPCAIPIAVSAVWFGAVHLEPLQFPALALVGGICAFAAAREGRLAPAILVHMGFNVVTVIALGAKL